MMSHPYCELELNWVKGCQKIRDAECYGSPGEGEPSVPGKGRGEYPSLSRKVRGKWDPVLGKGSGSTKGEEE